MSGGSATPGDEKTVAKKTPPATMGHFRRLDRGETGRSVLTTSHPSGRLALGTLKGLCLMRNGQVLVEYGKRRVPISPAQYRANGYRPLCDKLPPEALPNAATFASVGRAPTNSQ
jgi:hypothetical protein